MSSTTANASLSPGVIDRGNHGNSNHKHNGAGRDGFFARSSPAGRRTDLREGVPPSVRKANRAGESRGTELSLSCTRRIYAVLQIFTDVERGRDDCGRDRNPGL